MTRIVSTASIVLTLVLALVQTCFAQYQDASPQKLSSFIDLRADYGGEIGARVDAVVQNWSKRAPKANPAMFSVFGMREREPKSSSFYVPWVGEFVGKYLENTILLTQMTNDKELKTLVDVAVSALIVQQDRDGYLGPYSKDERLYVCWDLWGHYHAMTALMLYYERTGDSNALEAARRAGFFFEKRFYHKDKEGVEVGVKDVGSDEVNFAIVTALCQLYRLTDEEHYLDAARLVMKDLEERGDFYREGLAGTEFYHTPQPRWESLHTILGLEEFHRVDGDETYLRAFLNLWESVYKRDVHNNGSFSSGEQAVGTPFKNSAIETCCTVAWIALTVEALRATADPRCADALENSLYNAVCAYTHPSGSWCAYDTPMNGRREGSTQTIAFQARPGQPDLNCCSVNSPRGFAELANWGVMRGKDAQGRDAIYVNYYGEGTQSFRLGAKKAALTQKTSYPVDGHIELEFGTEDGETTEITVYARVPQWAQGTTLTIPGEDSREVAAGEYVAIERAWKRGETVALDFPMALRYIAGDGDFSGKASIYYGPLLLAYDQYFNAYEPEALPTFSPKAFEDAKIELVRSNPTGELIGFYSPQIFVKLDTLEEGATPIFLVDFAFAGALGSSYASWLPAAEIAPPVPACETPLQDQAVGPGAIAFTWRRVVDAQNYRFKVVVASDPEFADVVFEAASDNAKDVVAPAELTKALEPSKTYYWKVVAENAYGATESLAPSRRFRVDPTLPEFDLQAYRERRSLNKNMRTLIDATTPGRNENVTVAEDGTTTFNGVDSIVTYELSDFPRVEFEARLEFVMNDAPAQGRIAQIVSAWCKGVDDPLRVAVDSEGRLYGAVESTARGGRTVAVKLERGRRYALRVEKVGKTWTLYLDDEEVGRVAVEATMNTECDAIALGGNPKFRGQPEFFNGEIRAFELRGICE